MNMKSVKTTLSKRTCKPMIEPMLSLAMSMQSNKGVYALLLGSGISKSAGIPTGWEIVLDLINRVREIHPDGKKGDKPNGIASLRDLETWYVDTYGKQPDYSNLLDEIAKTPASRSQLLKSYFEPTEAEREEGKKLPTIAHKAIAKLVAKGYIKVIITTNFDRLLEQALKAEGITPQIISNANQINSAFPIVHHPCTIVKVHGDYIEADTGNTVAELETYDEALNNYLDRIFDEFGLIISGWSAEWDTALRNAIIRCPNRRFATYWTDRGKRNDKAQDLINHRRAELIKITDADSFFQELEEKVASLEEINQNHPLDTQVAVQTLKRYLAEDKYRIKLHDFVNNEVEILIEKLSNIFQNQNLSTVEDFKKRLKQYEIATERLISIFIIGCYHCQPEQEHLWLQAFERIVNTKENLGSVNSVSLQDYPDFILLYAACISALKADKYKLFASLITKTKFYGLDLNGDRLWLLKIIPVTSTKSIYNLSEYFPNQIEHRFYPTAHTFDYIKTPISDSLESLLEDPLKQIMYSKLEYQKYFDKFEYFLSLIYANYYTEKYLSFSSSILPCCYIWRGNSVKKEIDSEVNQYRENWQLLQAGLFDSSLERFLEIRESRNEYKIYKF